MQHGNPQTISYVITGAIVAIVFFFRFRSMNRERRLKLEYMWIFPVVMMAATAALFLQFPPHGMDWAWLALIFLIGSAIGWMRGRLIPITIDPETHLLNTKPSPAAILFLLALLVIRFALKAVLQAEASTLHLNAVLLTDGFVVLGVGLFAVSRIEMALRAWGLLRDARAARAAAAA